MSGGSFNYGYIHLEEYFNKMEDAQLNEMIEDFQKVLHDVEWYTSGDISEESYRETVTKFKKKWFKQRGARAKMHIEEQFMPEKKKNELLKELEDIYKNGR